MCVRPLLLLLAALPALAGPVGPVGPSFSVRQQQSVVARVGDVAALKCRVDGLADRVVSWVRSSDLQILTHAGAVFTADSRVTCSEAPYYTDLEDADDSSGELAVYRGGVLTSRDDASYGAGSEHALRIERLRVGDSGRYECQINTEPKLSLFFNLTVVESSLPSAVVRALESPGRAPSVGEPARWCCEARYEPAPPEHALAALPPLRIVWTHDGETVDPQSPRGGISLDTERWPGRVVSRLTLSHTTRADAGRWACGAEGAGGSSQEWAFDVWPGGGTEGESEWMQRDQAVARVSSVSARQPGAALWTTLALLSLLLA